ncbi:MAG TPA: winged helix-turn-helix domain-containing protein [Solirubrobacterales bacterium]|nr:winged helix-turn-helix domain-containing protein [Solirubrobacterales bacterium]
MPKTKHKKDGVEQIVAKAFAHPLRVQILIILNERVASPNLLAQELDQSLNLVAYHVRVLEKYDCIELVDTKQRRGATEHFYRATRRQFLSDDEWSRMPKSLRPGMAGAVLKSVFEDIEDASKCGTLDEVEDIHLSRTPMVVDRQGWDDVSETLKGALDRLLEIQTEASERIAAGEEQGILSKVHMLHFKSPSPKELSEAEAAESESAPDLTAS